MPDQLASFRYSDVRKVSSAVALCSKGCISIHGALKQSIVLNSLPLAPDLRVTKLRSSVVRETNLVRRVLPQECLVGLAIGSLGLVGKLIVVLVVSAYCLL